MKLLSVDRGGLTEEWVRSCKLQVHHLEASVLAFGTQGVRVALT